MWTRTSLLERVAAGETPDFLFFWGHTPRTADAVDASCLSQWYPARFEVDGIAYPTAEHFMMAEKARLFRDGAALARILAATSAAAAKAEGRAVKSYDDEAWSMARAEAVVRGNLAKFAQNAPLRELLLATGERVLVEASPQDRIWGIGLAASDEAARHPARWRGENLLGFALMETRTRLRL